jgi:hypothetical protein
MSPIISNVFRTGEADSLKHLLLVNLQVSGKKKNVAKTIQVGLNGLINLFKMY